MKMSDAIQLVRLYGPGTNAEIAHAAKVTPSDLYRGIDPAIRRGLLRWHEGMYMLTNAGRNRVRQGKGLFAREQT